MENNRLTHIHSSHTKKEMMPCCIHLRLRRRFWHIRTLLLSCHSQGKGQGEAAWPARLIHPCPERRQHSPRLMLGSCFLTSRRYGECSWVVKYLLHMHKVLSSSTNIKGLKTWNWRLICDWLLWLRGASEPRNGRFYSVCQSSEKWKGHKKSLEIKQWRKSS